MKLVIIRHAQSVANAENRWQGQKDYPLSDQGYKESEALKEKFELENFDPTFVYSSPLERAVRTAMISFPESNVVRIEDLKEEDIGVFSGKTHEEVQRDYAVIAEEFTRTRNIDVIPRSESTNMLNKRVVNVINFLVKGHNNEDVIAVFTHGGIMIPLINVLLQTKETWRINIPNGAVFQFNIDVDFWGQPKISEKQQEGFSIIQFADTRYLG